MSNQIKKWDWAFNVLMAHWIAILRGYLPFKLARENPEELREKGHVDAEGFQYIMKVAGIFDRIRFGKCKRSCVAWLSLTTHRTIYSVRRLPLHSPLDTERVDQGSFQRSWRITARFPLLFCMATEYV